MPCIRREFVYILRIHISNFGAGGSESNREKNAQRKKQSNNPFNVCGSIQLVLTPAMVKIQFDCNDQKSTQRSVIEKRIRTIFIVNY